MTNLKLLILFVAATGLCTSVFSGAEDRADKILLAQDAGVIEPTTEQKVAIDKCIEKLGDESFEVRTAAKVELLKIGNAAKGQLLRAKNQSRDAEVRGAVEKLLVALTNPYRKARVGDWRRIATSLHIDGSPGNGGSECKTVVTHVTESNVTLKSTSKTNGVESSSSTTINFEEPVGAPRPGETIKELATGKEIITIGGHDLETHWTEVESTETIQGEQKVSRIKRWINSDVVPFDGLVRSEIHVSGYIHAVVELKEFGREK